VKYTGWQGYAPEFFEDIFSEKTRSTVSSSCVSSAGIEVFLFLLALQPRSANERLPAAIKDIV
jgi:hypothetical protein